MLVIIIVSWNVRDLLRACLLSIERYPATLCQQQIIVVDNASSDGSVGMAQREFPHVRVVANAANRGFTGGNNDGIAVAEQWFASVGVVKMDAERQIADPPSTGVDRPSSDYVFLLNPDTEVTAGALDALLAYADATPDAGLIGPQLLYADGAVQSSRRRFPTLVTALFESTWLQPFAPRGLLDWFYMRDRSDDDVCDVDWVYGAAMLVRRETYRQCGVLDEQTFFMYSEEVDWCKRIKASARPGAQAEKGCWRVVYLPQARIIHYEGQSSAQVSARRMIHFNTSKVRYFHKHHGALQAAILRAALLGMFACQMLLEGSKWLLGHRRDLRAQRIAAYGAVLRSGLE